MDIVHAVTEPEGLSHDPGVLWARARRLSWRAKDASGPMERRTAYHDKARALSRLIRYAPEHLRVDDLEALDDGILGLHFIGKPHGLHLPVDHLDDTTRHALAPLVREAFLLQDSRTPFAPGDRLHPELVRFLRAGPSRETPPRLRLIFGHYALDVERSEATWQVHARISALSAARRHGQTVRPYIRLFLELLSSHPAQRHEALRQRALAALHRIQAFDDEDFWLQHAWTSDAALYSDLGLPPVLAEMTHSDAPLETAVEHFRTLYAEEGAARRRLRRLLHLAGLYLEGQPDGLARYFRLRAGLARLRDGPVLTHFSDTGFLIYAGLTPEEARAVVDQSPHRGPPMPRILSSQS